jgi:hypothetical protein
MITTRKIQKLISDDNDEARNQIFPGNVDIFLAQILWTQTPLGRSRP